MGPESWPLLSLLGSRAVLHEAGRAVTHRFAPPNIIRGRIEKLEAGEERLARGKTIAPEDFIWHPGDAGMKRFLLHCRERGLAAGGLRLHALLGDDIPLEALASGESGGDSPVSEGDLPVLRLTEIAFENYHFADAPEQSPQSASLRVLIYFNPLEEPELPEARAESNRLAEMLDGRCDDRYIARALDEEELRAHMQWADVVFYFGHGRNISGSPAVPASGGWIPFCPAGVDPVRKAIFFSACYRGPTAGLRFPGGCALFPLCRLADRPAPFLGDLVEAWVSGDELWRAYGRAIRRDSQAGDMRRFVFQLQGLNEIALRAGLFS